MAVSKFFRFIDESGRTSYGEVPQGLEAKEWAGTEVTVLHGDPFSAEGLTATSNKAKVWKVICPLESTPLVICTGLNYLTHAQEAGLKPSKCPVMFTKPADALAGPFDDISVHPIGQAELDYEAELCVIISKDAKNVKEADALDYVLGYTAGNDVTVRTYQLPEYSGNQYCFAKSFDQFAPIGPCIATKSAIPDPQDVAFNLKVNDSQRQKGNTNDMIFGVRSIIAHISQGTTLRKGTVVMTGTNGGIGYWMKPQGFIKADDKVHVTFEGIGTISNKFVFEK